MHWKVGWHPSYNQMFDIWLAYVWHLYWCAWMHVAFSYRDMSIDICRTDLAHVQHPVIHQSAMGRRWSQEGQGNREMRKKSGRTGRTRRTTREDQAEAGQETLTALTWNPEPPTWQMIFRKKNNYSIRITHTAVLGTLLLVSWLCSFHPSSSLNATATSQLWPQGSKTLWGSHSHFDKLSTNHGCGRMFGVKGFRPHPPKAQTFHPVCTMRAVKYSAAVETCDCSVVPNPRLFVPLGIKNSLGTLELNIKTCTSLSKFCTKYCGKQLHFIALLAFAGGYLAWTESPPCGSDNFLPMSKAHLANKLDLYSWRQWSFCLWKTWEGADRWGNSICTGGWPNRSQVNPSKYVLCTNLFILQ